MIETNKENIKKVLKKIDKKNKKIPKKLLTYIGYYSKITLSNI